MPIQVSKIRLYRKIIPFSTICQHAISDEASCSCSCMVLVSSRPNFITSLCHISKSIESRALFLYPSKSRWSKFENGNKTALYSQQLLRNNIRMGCRKDQVIPSSMCIRLGYLFLFRYLWWRCLPPSPSSLTLTSSTTGTLKHIP